MVLSLAFIIAFVGAAVALLIGITIFSEVSDALICPAGEAGGSFIDSSGGADGTYDSELLKDPPYTGAADGGFLGQQIEMTGETISQIQIDNVDFSSITTGSAGSSTGAGIPIQHTLVGDRDLGALKSTPDPLNEYYIGHLSSGNFIGQTLEIAGMSVYMEGSPSSGGVNAVILSNVTSTNNFEHAVVEAVSTNTISVPFDEDIYSFDFPSGTTISDGPNVFYGFNVTEDAFDSISFSGADGGFGSSGSCQLVERSNGAAWNDVLCLRSFMQFEILVKPELPFTTYELSGGISPANLVTYLTFDQTHSTNSLPFNNFTANAGTFGINSSGVLHDNGQMQNYNDNIVTGILGQGVEVTDTGFLLLSTMERDREMDFMVDDVTDLWGISFWTNSDDFGGVTDYAILANSLVAEEYGVSILVDGSQQVVIDIANDDGLILDTHTSTNTIPDSEWVHIGLTVDKSDGTNTVRLYINGTQDSTASVDFSAGVSNPIEGVFKLNDPEGSGQWFGTKTAEPIMSSFDDLCIWKGYQPSGTDMSNIYNSGSGQACSTVVVDEVVGPATPASTGSIRGIILEGDPDILGDNDVIVHDTSDLTTVVTYAGQADVDLVFTLNSPSPLTATEVFIGVELVNVTDSILWPSSSSDIGGGEGFCVESAQLASPFSGPYDFFLCGNAVASPGDPADLVFIAQESGGGAPVTGTTECEQAKETAWTVIGIIPVALFFALFAIFGTIGGGRFN